MKENAFTTATKHFAHVLLSGKFSQQDELQSVDFVISDIISHLKELRRNGKKVYLVGNGGSASVAGHICTDLMNVCKVSAQVLHEAPVLTCFSNDYGYDYGYAKQLEVVGQANDLLIAISSSGASQNILNAVSVARSKSMILFTLTGFDKNNPLRQQGNWNYWLDSKRYGEVEIGHLFLLHHISNQMNENEKN